MCEQFSFTKKKNILQHVLFNFFSEFVLPLLRILYLPSHSACFRHLTHRLAGSVYKTRRDIMHVWSLSFVYVKLKRVVINHDSKRTNTKCSLKIQQCNTGCNWLFPFHITGILLNLSLTRLSMPVYPETLMQHLNIGIW